jgi:LacI family transcriptional regulator, gluconate utilization system Gnt-I transcriptional repressor
MADVAARVGVSKMTVSRALSAMTSAPVAAAGTAGAATAAQASAARSSQLRHRIVQACEDMGYVIDQTARTFSSKRSGFVAALIPSLNNSNFSETAQGLTAAVEGSGLQLLLGYTDYRAETEERLVKAMLTRRPEAVVLTGGHHSPGTRSMLQAAGVPVVEIWDLPKKPIEHTVGFSNQQAMAAMVLHLHGQGYRRIAFMGSASPRDTRAADRRAGYEQAVQKLKLPTGRALAYGEPPISMAQGGEAVAQLLRQWPDTDAVVCASDLAAFGALMACQRHGWAVPHRLAIAGFGDFEVARACHPRITTVAVDCTGIGRAAGELLLRAVQAARHGQRLPTETVRVPFRIESREST